MTDETTELDELDEQLSPPRDFSREAALVSAGLSVLAGVLCILAPFRTVYTLRRGNGINVSFDGWGRPDIALVTQHETRYGIALTVVALVLVVAAASRLRDLRPVNFDAVDVAPDIGEAMDPAEPSHAGDDRLAATIGVAGSALLLGILASVALYIETVTSNTSANGASGDTTAAVGAMLWFLVAAWVISVAALYLPWFEARRRT